MLKSKSVHFVLLFMIMTAGTFASQDSTQQITLGRPDDPCQISIRTNPVDLNLKKADFDIAFFEPSKLDVQIYDAVGDLVYDNSISSPTTPTGKISGISWNLRNRNNRMVSCGTYLVVVKIHNLKNNSKRVLKFKLGVK